VEPRARRGAAVAGHPDDVAADRRSLTEAVSPVSNYPNDGTRPQTDRLAAACGEYLEEAQSAWGTTAGGCRSLLAQERGEKGA
jgi:hypothetical protein